MQLSVVNRLVWRLTETLETRQAYVETELVFRCVKALSAFVLVDLTVHQALWHEHFPMTARCIHHLYFLVN